MWYLLIPFQNEAVGCSAYWISDMNEHDQDLGQEVALRDGKGFAHACVPC